MSYERESNKPVERERERERERVWRDKKCIERERQTYFTAHHVCTRLKALPRSLLDWERDSEVEYKIEFEI